MKKTVQDLEIISNSRLNHDQHLLVMKSPVAVDEIRPGQFANLEVAQSKTTFLRRPFSIYTIDKEENTISFLIKRVGDGSKALTDMKPGEIINTIYPLGNSFTSANKGEKVLLVGGGVGTAPMYILAQELTTIGCDVNILLGARSAADLVELEKFEEYGNLLITTEDGSKGEKGFVTQHSVFTGQLKEFDRVYTCGPDPMMQAVARGAAAQGVSCEVSLENTMACGFGACLCCVTETTKGNKCVCTEGPVFNVKDLKW